MNLPIMPHRGCPYAAPGRPGRSGRAAGLLGVSGLGARLDFGAFHTLAFTRALEARGNGFRLCPTATRPTPALAIFALARRLGAAVGAVGVALAFLRFLAHRRFAPRLENRVGDRLRDQPDRADRVIVA